MKKLRNISTISLFAFLLAFGNLSVTAEENEPSANTNMSHQNYNSEHFNNNVTTSNAPPTALNTVLSKIHQGNMMEIEMGRLAMEKGQSRHVRNFGERLVRDHAMSDRKIGKIASKKQVSLVNDASTMTVSDVEDQAKQHETMARLKNATPSEFDQIFLQAMIQGHEKTLTLLSDATALDDKDARSVLQKIKPIVGQHHQIAEKLMSKDKTS